MFASSRWSLGIAVLALLSPLTRGQDPNRIKVDVVMDLTAAGKKLPMPTAEQPVYYDPAPLGQDDMGPNDNYYPAPPPPKEQIEHLIAVMLASQHYLLMTKVAHPSVILTFKWGYKSPNVVRTSRDDHYRTGTPMEWRNNNRAGSGGLTGVSLSSTADIYPEIAGTASTDLNEPAMEDLVGGHLVNFKFAQSETDPASREFADMTRYPRWYVQITALDYQAWTRHERVPLWRENISTDLYGHNLGQVLPTMVKIGGYFVGRELTAPALMTESLETPPSGETGVVPTKQ